MAAHQVRDPSAYITYTVPFKRLAAILTVGCCIAIYTSSYYRGRAIDAIRKVDDISPVKALSFKMPFKSQDFPNINKANNSVSWKLPNNGPSNAASSNLDDNLSDSVSDDRWLLLNTEAFRFESILTKLGLNNLTTADEDLEDIFLDDIEIVTAWSMNHRKEAA